MSNREIFIDKLRQLSKEEMLERYVALLNTEKLTDYVSDLEAKLAEKEKTIEDLRHYNDRLAQGIYHSYGEHFILKIKQDKISFAVEQLEKVKAELEFTSNNNEWITARDDKILNGICDFIDNQIKAIKEMKNDRFKARRLFRNNEENSK